MCKIIVFLSPIILSLNIFFFKLVKWLTVCLLRVFISMIRVWFSSGKCFSTTPVFLSRPAYWVKLTRVPIVNTWKKVNTFCLLWTTVQESSMFRNNDIISKTLRTSWEIYNPTSGKPAMTNSAKIDGRSGLLVSIWTQSLR